MSQTPELEALIAYCAGMGICPMPSYWNRMFNLLIAGMDGKTRETVPLPLILAAWHDCGEWHKQDRFLTHLHLAAKHGKLAEVDKYLRALAPEQWHPSKDSR